MFVYPNKTLYIDIYTYKYKSLARSNESDIYNNIRYTTQYLSTMNFNLLDLHDFVSFHHF